VSRFLTDQLGSVHDPFRVRVADAIPVLDENEREPDITPELLWKIVHAVPEHVRACYVALAASGMDTGEYLALTEDNLHPLTCTISAPGTKTKARRATISVDPRLWEWVVRAVPAPVQYKWLRLYWKRSLAAVKADTTLRLKDLRHCCGQWAVNEGVAEAKVQTQLRHSTSTMTRRYTKSKDRDEVAHAVADHLLRSA
jgi:integrase